MCRKMICLVSFVSVLALVLTNFAQADLIGYWRFDESSGTTAADSAGGDNDGTLIGDDLVWTTGRSGGALSFPGVPDDARVEFPTTGMSATAGTVAMWGLLADPQPAQNKYFFGHTTQPQWANRIQLYMNDGDNLLDIGLGDSHTLDTDIMELPMEEWVHVALTWDSGSYVVYVDGEEVSSGAYAGLSEIHPIANIGNNGTSGPYKGFAGLLDEVRLYDHALNADNILYLLYPEPIECLIAHWKLDEIEGAIAYDSVGDNDGILYGNPIWQPMGGMLGGALEFDGDNDYVDCGTFNPSDATGQLSICLWAKWNGLNGRYQGLIGKRNSWNVNNMMWQLETSHISGNVMFEREGYAGVAGGILTEGDWEHWCVTFDGATAIIYRMGEEVNRGAFSFGSKTDAQVVLGGSNAANPFNGALDDVRIYDYALNAAEILAAMEGVEQVDITAPGDIVQGVPNDGDWPTAYYRPETPDLAIDDNIETKYLHFKGDFEPDPGTGGAGFQVTPSAGATIVTGLTLITANDFPGRDPIAFELSGSNEGIDGPYELIASDYIVDFAQALAWPRLTMNATPISFYNDVAYGHYQLIFTAIRGPVGGSVNSMQIAEVELLGVPAPAGANIILVTEAIDWDLDGLRDDHSLESFLVSEGHILDVRPDYWKVLTPDKIAELNAADLIIFSRLAWSNHYNDDNETTQWNSLTTPLLQMSAYFACNTRPRWKWVNAGTPSNNPHIQAEVMAPNHPVFRGVLTAYDPTAPADSAPLPVVQMVDPFVGTGLTSFVDTTDMGNGQLIAKPVGFEMGWIAEWDVGVEFYEGAGQYAGGKRMLFCAGTQEIQSVDPDTQEVITTAQGELNLTAEGLQTFRNAINYLLGSTHIILVTEAIDWDLDGLRDDHSLESFLVSEGHSVDVRPDYWKELDPDKISELNAADLIIFSRLAWSNHYIEGNETTQWNSLTTPLLQMNSHFARNTRWKWVNSGTPAETPYIDAVAVAPYHPVFWGVPLTAPNPTDRVDSTLLIVIQMIDPLVGTGLTSFIGSTDMGNGQLIAKPVWFEMGWIAEWDVGVEFFEGAGQYAGGRRMLFCAGTQEIQFFDYDRQEVITTAQGELNLTAEGLQMFRNAIDYLLNSDSTGGIFEPGIGPI